MINIQYISRCVIQISNSVRFTMPAVSLDYRFSSVSFKRPLQSVLQTDARARWHCEHLPLIIHALSWLRQSDTSQSNTESRTTITIRARNLYTANVTYLPVRFSSSQYVSILIKYEYGYIFYITRSDRNMWSASTNAKLTALGDHFTNIRISFVKVILKLRPILNL